jgi:hypothetical protein
MMQHLDSSQLIGLGLIVFIAIIVLPVLIYTMRKEKNNKSYTDY